MKQLIISLGLFLFSTIITAAHNYSVFTIHIVNKSNLGHDLYMHSPIDLANCSKEPHEIYFSPNNDTYIKFNEDHQINVTFNPNTNSPCLHTVQINVSSCTFYVVLYVIPGGTEYPYGIRIDGDQFWARSTSSLRVSCVAERVSDYPDSIKFVVQPYV